MIPMILPAMQFFKKEKFYAFLFLVVIAIYASMWFWPDKNAKEDAKDTPAVQAFHKAEERLQSKMQKGGALADYLKAHPELEAVFIGLSFLIAFALTAGLVIDYFIFFKPGWRSQFAFDARPPSRMDGKLSMIFKVVLLFITGSYLLGGILGLIRRYLFPAGDLNFNLLLHTFIMDFLCLFFVLHVVQKEGGTRRDLGLSVPSNSIPTELAVGWGGYAAILPVFGLCLVALIGIAQIFHYEPSPHPLVNVFLEEENRSPYLISFSIFLATAYGPIFEEVFFRGFCYQVFKRRFGIFPAMLISAAFFALIHANTFAFWPIFILGLALAWLFEKRGSLLPGIILHVTHNTIFITYFFLAKKIVQQAAG